MVVDRAELRNGVALEDSPSGRPVACRASLWASRFDQPSVILFESPKDLTRKRQEAYGPSHGDDPVRIPRTGVSAAHLHGAPFVDEPATSIATTQPTGCLARTRTYPPRSGRPERP